MEVRFFFGREDLRGSHLQILEGKLVAQLPTIRYSYTSKGQIKIESKESMRKRGLKSPDFADCLCILNHIRRKYYNRKPIDRKTFQPKAANRFFDHDGILRAG